MTNLKLYITLIFSRFIDNLIVWEICILRRKVTLIQGSCVISIFKTRFMFTKSLLVNTHLLALLHLKRRSLFIYSSYGPTLNSVGLEPLSRKSYLNVLRTGMWWVIWTMYVLHIYIFFTSLKMLIYLTWAKDLS